MLDQYLALAKFFNWKEGTSPLATHPHLASFHQTFAALPANRAYFKSALASLPSNNKMAVFGSTPTGILYVPGQPCPWHGSTGQY